MQKTTKNPSNNHLTTKSRSRSCLRKPKQVTLPLKKLQNFPTIKTLTKFLEDDNSTPISQSTQQFQKKAKINQQSNNYSIFSRVQTAIEDTQESKEKGKSSRKGSFRDEEQEPGHFEFRIGQIIAKKYKIVKHICDGTFGRVLEVEDLKDKFQTHYALKIIRPIERYIESAKDEAEIIKKLPHSNNMMKLIDTFYHKHHYCLLTPLYGDSLAVFLEKNSYRGYPINSLQSIIKQLINSLSQIHNIGLAHTDLKPENILLQQSSYETYDDNYKVPTSDNIILIDFGNATFNTEHHSRIINTREYRAPEVLLQCCKWTEISDMWAVGCIICELYNGECMFGGMFQEGEDDLGVVEHLKRIEKVSGEVPEWMVYGAPQNIQEMIAKRKLRNSEKVQIKMDQLQSEKDVIQNIHEMLVVEDIIDGSYPQLIDLVKKLLVIDPIQRISAKDALNHPFFSINYN